MTAWVHKQFRDTRTSVATMMSIVSAVGVLLGLAAVAAMVLGS